MLAKFMTTASLVFLIPMSSFASEIRQRPFAYSFDAASAQSGDTFVVCSDCPDNKLTIRPAITKLAVRMSDPMTIQPPATQPDVVTVTPRNELPEIKGLTHMIRIMNPGASPLRPTWFSGEFLALAFGDVISVADAKNFRTRAPDTGDIVAALNFCAPALSDAYGRILVSCDYGASRSPALALVIVAHQLGVGQEQVALEMILAIRPEAVPNQMVVRLGDMLLKRDGTLVSALNTLYADINQRLFK